MSQENFQKKIKKNYIEHVTGKKSRPISVKDFMEEMGEEEKTFHAQFSSFSALEQAIWLELIEETVGKVKEQEVYPQYTVREKLLSFLYTLLEEMKPNRGFIDFCIEHSLPAFLELSPECLKTFRAYFLEYASELVNEGLDTQELASRPFLSERYKDLMWGTVLFTIHFWLKDTSEGFEKTDAAVEKSVTLAIDLMARTPVDTAFDLLKFLYQNK